MSKIVFVIPNMTGGGTERVIALLANELIEQAKKLGIEKCVNLRGFSKHLKEEEDK